MNVQEEEGTKINTSKFKETFVTIIINKSISPYSLTNSKIFLPLGKKRNKEFFFFN